MYTCIHTYLIVKPTIYRCLYMYLYISICEHMCIYVCILMHTHIVCCQQRGPQASSCRACSLPRARSSWATPFFIRTTTDDHAQLPCCSSDLILCSSVIKYCISKLACTIVERQEDAGAEGASASPDLVFFGVPAGCFGRT